MGRKVTHKIEIYIVFSDDENHIEKGILNAAQQLAVAFQVEASILHRRAMPPPGAIDPVDNSVGSHFKGLIDISLHFVAEVAQYPIPLLRIFL